MSQNLILAGGMVLFLIMPLSIYLLIKAQTFDGNTLNSDGTMKTRSKVVVGAMVSFLLLTFAGIGALMYSSNKPAEFFVDKGILDISGLYGEEIMLSEISSITLKEQMPEVISKNNGSSIGSRKKGFFQLEDIGQAKLFVYTNNPPFIFLEGTSGLRVLNARYPAETVKLYESILEAWRHIQKDSFPKDPDVTNADLRLFAYPGNYIETMSSTPGICIAADYPGPGEIACYSTENGSFLTWNITSGSFAYCGQEIKLACDRKIYWTPYVNNSISKENLSASTATITVGILDENETLLAKKEVKILYDGVYSVMASPDVVIDVKP